jgi:hypothetical protein
MLFSLSLEIKTTTVLYMTESIEICTVFLGSSMLDNDYTLYEDGRVKHFYDVNQWSLNNTEWLDVSSLSNSIKTRLLENCSEASKEKVGKLLDL